jgi:hypothetical protein
VYIREQKKSISFYDIDEEIYDQIVVNWIEKGKLEAEDGSEVVVLKQIGKI